MIKNMTITVIIPTYKRTNDLKNCLISLSQQNRFADEILVVTRDTDFETQSLLDSSFLDKSLPLRKITVVKPGQVIALNMGLEMATGDIVCITDDDTIPHQDWLERIELYFQDPQLGGIGGRDFLYLNGKLIDGNSLEVGKVQWCGRVIANHSTGMGEVQEVDWLKGANMSYRRSAIGDLRFDIRLKGRGAQGSNDLAFGLSLRRRGWKLLYDPKVAVDHYPSIRSDGDERHSSLFSSREAYYIEAYNQGLTLLEYLQGFRKITHIVWAILVGTRSILGMAQAIRLTPSYGIRPWGRWLITLQGYRHALLETKS